MNATVGTPPAITEETQAFWTAAREGRLVVEQCDSCHTKTFPLRGICPSCRARAVSPVQISGIGRVYSFTVNHQRWRPDLEVPYALVVVEFPDHPGIRILGRLRECPPDGITIGSAVEIGFEPGPGGVAIPSFVAVTE
jgi:uncharacterized OB-fold protein